MSNKREIFDRLANCIIAGDKEAIVETTKEALAKSIAPLDIINKGLTPGMRTVGDRFSRYEIYLPEMMLAAETWEIAMRLLEPELSAAEISRQAAGKVVVGTVKGDVHSLGKNILAQLLRAAGFEAYDLGVDVRASTFISEAERVGADIICASALMTTTMPHQKDIIEYLESKGKRDAYCVLVGGGCTTQEWADKIGADGYGKRASDGVKLALKFMAEKGKGGD